VTRHGTLCSILDAKYRDLWEKQLPREMLYQLVVYAISDRQQPQSSILYPTTNPLAKEARIDISDPLFGKPVGQVCLRPVLLPLVEKLATSKTSQAGRELEALARRLTFGE
jgi:5-methylcytosine-specific restriction enzyme subunit McrC